MSFVCTRPVKPSISASLTGCPFSLPLILSDRVPEGLEDVSKYANLFSSLYGSGNWTLLDLKKLAGLNFLRVWREVEKVRRCFVEKRKDGYFLIIYFYYI